ncbi:MAG: hypothetical protein ABI359_12585 [Ginsengibacter sp.]
MNRIAKWISKLNSQQKLITAIALPVILFFISIKLAGIAGEITFGHITIERPFEFGKPGGFGYFLPL